MIWESGINFVTPKIHVDPRVLLKCIKIQQKVAPNEFSVISQVSTIDDYVYIRPPIIVPKQRVSPTSVDYLENLAPYRKHGYHAVIHSHPFAEETAFSAADEAYINRNFPVSLLLNKFGDIVDARLCLTLSDRIKVVLKPPAIEIETGLGSLKKALTNITFLSE